MLLNLLESKILPKNKSFISTKELRRIIREQDIRLEDIFNADESVPLFFIDDRINPKSHSIYLHCDLVSSPVNETSSIHPLPQLKVCRVHPLLLPPWQY